jgi:hypothetical protein
MTRTRANNMSRNNDPRPLHNPGVNCVSKVDGGNPGLTVRSERSMTCALGGRSTDRPTLVMRFP